MLAARQSVTEKENLFQAPLRNKESQKQPLAQKQGAAPKRTFGVDISNRVSNDSARQPNGKKQISTGKAPQRAAFADITNKTPSVNKKQIQTVKQTRVKAIERPYPRVNPDTTEIEKVYLPEPELIEEPQIDFAALMRMPVFVQEPGSPLSPSIEEEMMNFSLEVVPAIPDDDNIDDLLYSMDDLGRLSPPILDLDVDLAM